MPADPLYREKELFTLITQCDEAAFRELFHLYVPLVRSLVLKVTREETAVPDIIQEVFLRVWLNRDKLPEVHDPRPWMIQIVYRQCFNWLRQQKVRSKANDQLAKGMGLPFSNSTEESASFEDTSRLVRQAIEQLPPQAKRVYLLSREEGLKIADIAQQLHISPQTVKNTLGRSLKDIREYLEQRGIFLPIFLLGYWFL